MDGKPLSICVVCTCDPCKCNSSTKLQLVLLTYRVGNDSFTLHLPKKLLQQYASLYKELEVMNADGSVVVYSSGVVREKSNENQ